jgi:hypothetical protein
MVTFVMNLRKQLLINFSRFITPLAAALFLLGSCGEHAAFKQNISEGTIEYEVTYPELDSSNILLEMLPDKMVMKFKKDKYRSELKTAAGIIEMAVVADRSEEKMYNLVKIFSDRYVLEMDKEEALKMTSTLPAFNIVNTDVQLTIAEAKCNKIELDFEGSDLDNFEFCYTDEIDLLEPNWCTPYNEVGGVFLDYRIENYGMKMRLKAIRIISEEIDDEEFTISDEYKSVTAEEFDKLVVKNMEISLE